MNSEQISLIKSSWQNVLPIQDKAAELFYAKLFEMDPSLKELFKEDMAEQRRALMMMLNTVIMKLDRLEEILPDVCSLAVRHVNYGVKDRDYDTVGGALLWTLGAGLGDAFTPEIEKAWATAYSTLANTMKTAAWPAGL